MTSEKYLIALKQIQAILNEALSGTPPASSSKKPAQPQEKHAAVTGGHLSFDVNILAFMNKHAKGLSGAQKFTLLVARLAKGSTTAEVPYQEISAQWNRMTTVLGDFNAAHGNRAKAQGWVDSEKKGMWKLTSSWKDTLA